jgi:hypothetical protein
LGKWAILVCIGVYFIHTPPPGIRRAPAMTTKTAKASKPSLRARVDLAAKKAEAVKKLLAARNLLVKAKVKKAASQSPARAISRYEVGPPRGAKSAATHKDYPISYAGKWIGWTPDARKIVASGRTPQKVLALAKQAGYREVILERVPRNLEPVEDKSHS